MEEGERQEGSGERGKIGKGGERGEGREVGWGEKAEG